MATEEIKEKIKKFLEASEDVRTTCGNLWDRMKGFLKGKVLAKTGTLVKKRY